MKFVLHCLGSLLIVYPQDGPSVFLSKMCVLLLLIIMNIYVSDFSLSIIYQFRHQCKNTCAKDFFN